MADRAKHFTGETSGTLMTFLGNRDTGRVLGSLALLAIVTSPVWLTAFGLLRSIAFLADPVEAVSAYDKGDPYAPVTALLVPYGALAVMATVAHLYLLKRRADPAPATVRARTAISRRVAYGAWALFLLVAIAGGAWSGVYTETAFRLAHPGLDSRSYRVCPVAFRDGMRDDGIPWSSKVEGYRTWSTLTISECFGYLPASVQDRLCAGPLPAGRPAYAAEVAASCRSRDSHRELQRMYETLTAR